jgi:hypothetical protein
MNNDTPVISVITRHHPDNLANLAVLIDSLYSQTHEEWEHIIVVDAEMEDSADVLALTESLGDDRFKLEFTGSPLDVLNSYPEMRGVELAVGDLLCFIPDIWYLSDRHMAEHIDACEKNQRAVGSICEGLGEEGITYDKPGTGLCRVAEFLSSARNDTGHIAQCMLRFGGHNASLSVGEIEGMLDFSLSLDRLLCTVVSDEPLVFNSLSEGRELFADVMGV